MAVDPNTVRLCERCATPGVPYGMHACRECRALYCTPACAVAHWRSGGHRQACSFGRDERFVADVAYGLRASHLTTCVVCTCSSRPEFDPRLRTLGLEPISILQPCLETCFQARMIASGATQRGTPATRMRERAADIAAAIATESDRRTDLDTGEFAVLFDLLATAIRCGSIDVDAAAVERLWKVCRMLFKTLIRMPIDAPPDAPVDVPARTPAHTPAGTPAHTPAGTPARKQTPQSAIYGDLLATLRKWADVGQKCADMYVTMVISELVPAELAPAEPSPAEPPSAALIDGVDYRLAFRALQESLIELL
jgi:hypothetical protein